MNIDPRYRNLFSELIQTYARSLVRYAVFTYYGFTGDLQTEQKLLRQRRENISDILCAMAKDRDTCREFINHEIQSAVPDILLDFEFSYEERLELLEKIRETELF